ncbi:MAG TPA: DUF3592 domain-containing protein [Pirellulaceae bacterium]|nr:DUF3592 domain-containing protein [Pirellulaceae bacterium]
MNTLSPRPIRQGPTLPMLLVALGLAFVLVAYVTYLRPEMRVNREFIATDCEILDKRLMVTQDRNGTVYRPEFDIRYEVAGEVHEASTYDITSASTSGRANKEDILSRFDVGSRYTCWYDPLNPRVVVLVRGYSAFGFALVAFGGLLLIIGLVGML